MAIAGAVEGYFDLEYYRAIESIVARWLTLEDIDEYEVPEAEDREACTRLLFLEARLVDRNRLEEWLDLFTDDCAYWLPADVSGADPACTVSWEFNDRRRLEERVERILTGKAYSQLPATRTVHSYTNLEFLRGRTDDEIHVLCNFQIQTYAHGEHSVRAGWNGFILRREGDEWRIALKRVNLFDADQPQGDNSFFL